MAKPNLTAARLREVLDYNPGTGGFTWKVRPSCRVSVGGNAGSITDGGYCVIRIDRRIHRAHRLAWLYVYGEWPANMVDHKNGCRADNRIENLRAASHQLNAQNMRAARSDNSSGKLGVSWDSRRGKWLAQIKDADGKHRHLGRFATPEAAYDRYLDAKRSLHQGCTL